MSIETIAKYLDQYHARFYRYSHEKHIERWVSQFSNQDVIIAEISHLMDKVFIEEQNETVFFENLLKNQKVISDIGSPENCSILDIQQTGKSQAIYSKKMQKVFQDTLDVLVPINDFSKNVLIYVDDFMFSGMKARHDILNVFKTYEKKKIIYIFIGVHSNADYYLDKEFKANNITKTVWRCITLNNTLSKRDTSDTFWPKESIQSNPAVIKYINDRKFNKPVMFRSDTSQSCGDFNLFTNSTNRGIIENEFLLAGLKIIEECNTNLPPLGVSAFKGLGFGGTVMSYRNIPNNTPLCLWWGNPENQGGLGSWYPLMMRKVYD